MMAFFAAAQLPRSFDYFLTILNKIESSGSVLWNAAIRGFSDNDDPELAVLVYKRMLLMHNFRPDNYTFPFVLKACGRFQFVGRIGEEVHGHVLKLGFDLDVYVQNALIHVSCACGKLENPCKLLDEVPQRDLFSWNSMINGYIQCGRPIEALGLFRGMEAVDVEPDVVTMIGVASACSHIGRLDVGNWVHDFIIGKGIKLTTKLCNAMLDMYVKCGCLDICSH